MSTKNFVEKLQRKLDQIDPESLLVNQSFDKNDLERLSENGELDEIESSIIKLLQMFYKSDVDQIV